MTFPGSTSAGLQAPAIALERVGSIEGDVVTRLAVFVERHPYVRPNPIIVCLVPSVRRIRGRELESAEDRRDIDDFLSVRLIVHAGTVSVGCKRHYIVVTQYVRIVCAPLVRREGREVAGAAWRNNACSTQRFVVGTTCTSPKPPEK